MEKIHVLSCVNEDGMVVSNDAFFKREDAVAEMRKQWEAQVEVACDEGWDYLVDEPDGHYASVYDKCSNGQSYEWYIIGGVEVK